MSMMGKRNWRRYLLSVVLIFSMLLGGNIARAAENGEDEYDEPSYFAEMGNLYQLAYDDYSLTFCWYSGGNHTGFEIYRKSNLSEEYELIDTVDNQQFQLLEYTDDDFRRGIKYTYLVVAFEEDEEGYLELDSRTESWKIKIAQAQMQTVKRKDKTNAKLSWYPVAGVDGYEVYQKTTGGTFKLAKRISGEDTLKCTIKNISTKKNTTYKVRGYVKQDGSYAYGAFSTKLILKKILSALAAKFQALQKKYPNGKYWNHAGERSFDSTTVTDVPCFHGYDGLAYTCNYYDCPDGILGYQCYGFAWKMSDLIYGKSAKIKNFYSFSKCKAGDVIRYSGHSVIIVSKHTNYIVVGECNYGDTCMIKWGRKIYPSELVGAKYSRRYK